jgi:hypothetical protein
VSDGAAQQGDEADEAWSTSELRSLSPVFGGHEVRSVSTGQAKPTRPRIPSPLAIAGTVVGGASLVGNIVWNCNTCGWDLDGVPWYEAFLVAGVPFVVAPLGIVLVGVRALLLRTRSASIEFGATTLGLALPWLYFLFASLLNPL